MSTTMFAHPMLRQAAAEEEEVVWVPYPDYVGPEKSHFPETGEYWGFPHIDEAKVCWQPLGYIVDEDFEGNELWADYEADDSEIIRVDCGTTTDEELLLVCERILYWEEVDCDIYHFKLPLSVVLPVQIFSWIWELHVVMIFTLPWYLIILTVAAIDWLLDWVWLGLFFWCGFCSGVMLWLTNLLMLPFHIWGWMQYFHLETYGLMIDGWMLFFGFSGCYLAIGKHCFFKKDWGNPREAIDIPLLFINPGSFLAEGTSTANENSLASFFALPQLEKPEDVLTYRHNSRANWLHHFPGYSIVNAASSAVMELFDI